MKVTRKKLESAVAEEIISQEQSDNLYNFLQALPANGPSFDFTHILYYMGGLIAIGAMTDGDVGGWQGIVFWSVPLLLPGILGLARRARQEPGLA